MNKISPSMEVRILGPDDAELLGDLFESLSRDPATEFFRPHALTRGEAAHVASVLACGQDLYFVASDETEFVGYGMLRGWDEGYSVPSFGVAVEPRWRGRGVGRMLLSWAVSAARERGCSRMILKVDPSNVVARRLYESQGFKFDELAEDGVQLKGVLQL